MPSIFSFQGFVLLLFLEMKFDSRTSVFIVEFRIKTSFRFNGGFKIFNIKTSCISTTEHLSPFAHMLSSSMFLCCKNAPETSQDENKISFCFVLREKCVTKINSTRVGWRQSLCVSARVDFSFWCWLIFHEFHNLLNLTMKVAIFLT